MKIGKQNYVLVTRNSVKIIVVLSSLNYFMSKTDSAEPSLMFAAIQSQNGLLD